jgi:hypothetical protein
MDVICPISCLRDNSLHRKMKYNKILKFLKRKLNIKEIIKCLNDFDKLKVILFEEDKLKILESIPNPIPQIGDEKNLWEIPEYNTMLNMFKFKNDHINNYLESSNLK